MIPCDFGPDFFAIFLDFLDAGFRVRHDALDGLLYHLLGDLHTILQGHLFLRQRTHLLLLVRGDLDALRRDLVGHVAVSLSR